MTNFEKQKNKIYSISEPRIGSRGQSLSNYVIYCKNGERYTKYFSGKSIEIIEEKIEKFVTETFMNELILLSNSIRYENFFTVWLEKIKKIKVKPQTFNKTQFIFRQYIQPHIGHIPLCDIKNTDIQNLINKLTDTGYSPSIVRSVFFNISASFRYYRIISEQASNPCEGITLPKPRKPDPRYLLRDERMLLEESAFSTDNNGNLIYRYGPALVLLMYTGMRVCEAIALTWQDIDFFDKLININKSSVRSNENGKIELITQKGGKTPCSLRYIPMTSKARWCLIELKQLSKGSTYVISDSNGDQVNPTNLYQCFNRLLKNSGIIGCGEHRTVHSLRHTFASMLFENGCNSKIISELLGHSSVRFTENTYIHIIHKLKAKAISDIDLYCK